MDLRHLVIKNFQKLFWIYLTENFVISGPAGFKPVAAKVPCNFVLITPENAARVAEFREAARVAEYRGKLLRGEIGFFAECEGRMAGSIWATVNHGLSPKVARAYMKLAPEEAMVHDIVTGDASRGKGVGPFMVGQIAEVLLGRYAVTRIVIDVNARNQPSLRMMEKAGVAKEQRVFYVSAFSTQVWHKVLRQY